MDNLDVYIFLMALVVTANLYADSYYNSNGPIDTFTENTGFSAGEEQLGEFVDGEFVAPEDGNYSFNGEIKAVSGPGQISVKKRGNQTLYTNISLFGDEITTSYTELKSGESIELDTKCSEICESIEVSNIKVNEWEDQSQDYLYRLGSNWYQGLETESRKWAYSNSTVYIYNYDDEPINKELWISGNSFNRTRNITYILNENRLGEKVVSPKDYRIEFRNNGEIIHPLDYPVKEEEFEGDIHYLENKYNFRVTLKPGENKLEIKSPTECDLKGEVNANDDIRCAIYGLENIYVLD